MSSNDRKKQIRLSPELILKFKGLKKQMGFGTYEEIIWYLLSNREVWIGHLKEDRSKWFLSWSDDLERIEDLIKEREGEIEENSWQKIMENGYLMFDAGMDEDERVHLNEGQMRMTNNEIEEWIRELIKFPVEPEKGDDQ